MVQENISIPTNLITEHLFKFLDAFVSQVEIFIEIVIDIFLWVTILSASISIALALAILTCYLEIAL